MLVSVMKRSDVIKIVFRIVSVEAGSTNVLITKLVIVLAGIVLTSVLVMYCVDAGCT